MWEKSGKITTINNFCMLHEREEFKTKSLENRDWIAFVRRISNICTVSYERCCLNPKNKNLFSSDSRVNFALYNMNRRTDSVLKTKSCKTVFSISKNKN